MVTYLNLKNHDQRLPLAKRQPNLGERNRNPLNIRYVPSNHWLGLSETTPNVQGFCCFKHADYGYRAAIILLLNYIRKHGCTTPEKIIYRWAPPTENDTELYIACVCGRADIPRNQELDTNSTEFNRLVAAMARQESGAQTNEAKIQALRQHFNLF
jgi:hypothetical protein